MDKKEAYGGITSVVNRIVWASVKNHDQFAVQRTEIVFF